MKHFFCIIFLYGLLLTFISNGATELYRPSADRKYNETAWLCTHNAYANQKDGYVYNNQYYGFEGQLKGGVRCFEIDIEPRCWSKGFGFLGNGGCTVSMCHDSCAKTKYMIPSRGFTTGLASTTGNPYGFRSSALSAFKKFLNDNPHEIVTIMLDNKIKDYKLLDQQFEDAALQSMILTPSDWNPIEHHGWPSLDWMIKNNKRMVVFNSKSPDDEGYSSSIPFASSKYSYYQWPMVVANQYGQLDQQKASVQREASKKNNLNLIRYLFELDRFADGGKILNGTPSYIIADIFKYFKKETPFAGDYSKVNGPELQALIDHVVSTGLDGKNLGRYPNFVKVDFFNEGYPLEIVNAINKLADDPAKLKMMFKPFEPT